MHALLLAACTPQADPGAPNVVVLVSDDQDYEHFRFMGHPLSQTPTIDAMAENGVLFTHAFAPVARCRPAQAALLSGLWPQQNGVYFNHGADHIDPDTSIANRLKERGYASFGEGKFWEFNPLLMGFSNYTIRNYETFARFGQEHLFERLEELDRDQPFFLWWAPMLPHVPHDPPARLIDRFDLDAIPVPEWYEGDTDAYRHSEQTSLAMEVWLDEEIAALRDKLEELGELDDTLFLFLVDNGYANGLPSKGTAFEKGLRTPAILSWPKGIEGGRSIDDLISLVDLHSTLLDYAGATPARGCEGMSLRPLIEGAQFEGRSALFGACYTQAPSEDAADPARDAMALWARTPRWKYVLYLQDVREEEDQRWKIQANHCEYPERRRGDVDLYDLESDPYELQDLSGRPDLADIARGLRADALAWWDATGGGKLRLP